MDRISRAEVGGPYASHDDALRAINNKGFDADPADLTVQEGASGDDTSKEALRTQAKFPPPADSGGGATSKPSPEDPLKDNVPTPKDAQDIDPTDDVAPDDTADPTAPDNGSSLPGLPEASGEPVDPLGDPETQVTTTKPAQVPSGGGGGMPGDLGAPGAPGMPGEPEEDTDEVGSEEDVSEPPEATAIPETTDPAGVSSTDPIGGAIDKVSAQILQDNPHLPHHLVRRVARKVVGKMVEANALMPNIEDPLADKSPLSVIRDVVRTLPKGSPAAAPSNEDGDDENAPGPGSGEPDGGPEGDDDDSSLPGSMPLGFQRGADGRLLAAGAEGAGAAELAPLLLV